MSQTGSVAIILGSARGIRRLDSRRSIPVSLRSVENSENSGMVLDWALHALSEHGVENVVYVGGYQIQKVIERYPDLDCRFHAAWQEEAELAALVSMNQFKADRCFVLRSDTVFLPGALDILKSGKEEIVHGLLSTAAGQESVGMVSLGGPGIQDALGIATEVVSANPQATLEDWMRELTKQEHRVGEVTLDGLAAPTSNRLALAQTVFGSKSRTLASIRPLLKNAVVQGQVTFNIGEWKEHPESILSEVKDTFGKCVLAVRSSAQSEDGIGESLAGHFNSVLDVSADSAEQVSQAIDRVVDSFGTNGRSPIQEDEVFIQPQVQDLATSGVLFTRDAETGAPYFVISMDSMSGRSDSVTSGAQAQLETMYISRKAIACNVSPNVWNSLELGRELAELMHNDSLDIELAIDNSGTTHLFQVRPIASTAQKFELADDDLEEELECVADFLDGQMQSHPFLHGSTTLFSTMSDWNPAEMIGTTPRPLALSLYQQLIGRSSWSEARTLIGYKDVRPEALIVSLGGRPYVNVRASLNSFLPSALDSSIAEKWVEFGLKTLRENPSLHDKIEFQVALTCITFDREQQSALMLEAGLSGEEVRSFLDLLQDLTQNVISGSVAPISEQLEILDEMQVRRQRILDHESESTVYLSRQVHNLLGDCERLGLVPFSVLARYAFIAMAMLRSLKSVGVFGTDEYESILRSIPTVATDLTADLAGHSEGRIDMATFLERFGHLRPSSYDITSPNYASNPELYILNSNPAPQPAHRNQPSDAAKVFEDHGKEIDQLIGEIGLSIDHRELGDFILRAIPARELAKFEFMKNVNAALEIIAKLGERLGFDRDQISFLTSERIFAAAINSPTAANITQLEREIEFAKKRWNLTCALRLPHLVKSKSDVYAFQLEQWTPNFVSTQRVVAPIAVLEGPGPFVNLSGRIVLIRAADPGYDWIFSHNIAGLITQFGGVGSHMAIRAAEFGLPAAIGCGDFIFDRVCGAGLVELDCISHRIEVIS